MNQIKMKKSICISKNMRKVYTIVFVSCLTVIIVSLAFNNNVWLDEGFSLNWSTLSFPMFLKRVKLDVCPLYLWMLRLVLSATGESLLAAKLFSAMALFLIFLLSATFVRKNFGLKAMTFFGLFLVCMPMVMKRAVEVRMYTWAFLWLLLSCMQMYYLLGDKATGKNWILFTLFSLAACYTHYFAVLSLVVVYVGMGTYFLFVRDFRRLRMWFVCSAFTVVGYLPWVPNILRQTNSETTSWIPGQSSILDTLRAMFYTDIPRTDQIFLVIIATFCIIGLVLFIKHKTTELYWSLVCMSTVWLVWIFGLVFEMCSRPILTRKYLMIPLCATVLGMSSLCKYINKYVVLVLCVFFILVGCDVYHTVYQEEYGTKTEETLQFAESHFKENDIIISDAGSLITVLPYYFPGRSTVDDVYSADYDYLWYFDVDNTLDMDKLKENNISYIDYGLYGFDVEFRIVYLFRE